MTGDVLIDRYVLGALLGKGGMGYVHEAVDLKMQRSVAVKLLGSVSPDGESLRRFSREALAAGSLQHPNVVGVFDTGEQQGRPFLVTELLRGETLRQVLRRGTPPVEQAREWARQLAAGLAAAHGKGLTHRDLKPSNIFITSDGWVKILDFGLVKLTEALQPSPDSDASRTLGTIGYMAPEQVRGQPVDARADLFNFGLVLYEMLAGKPAFADGSDTDTSYAIVVREPEPLPPEAPRQLRALVASCLAKDREKRPASAREVLRLLEMPETAAPSPRSRSWVLPAAALFVLLGALSLLALRRPSLAGALPAGPVAIFPFDARAAKAHAVLAVGTSDLLSRELSGAKLRAIDPASVRQVVNDDAAAQPIDRARAQALKLNARYFVLGRVEDRGGELRVSAALHDTESARPLAFADAGGKPEEILRLVCELAAGLQRQTLSPARLEARVAALQLQTTASLPALTAWLEGWQMWRAARWPEMKAAFSLAVAADPDFTLGLYDLGQMTMMFEQDTAENVLTRAMRHPERLSAAERLHAQNYLLRLQGRQEEAARLLFDAVRDHPDDPRIWRYLVGWLFHHGALLGHSPQEAADASLRQLELEPLDLDPIAHLLDLAQLRGERAAVLRLSERLLGIADNNPEDALGFRVAHAWASGSGAEHDEVMAALTADAAAPALRQALGRIQMQMDGSADAVTIAARLPFEPGLQPLAQANLLRGHVREARQAMADAISAHPGGDTAYYLPWIDTVELIEPSPAELAASRAAAAGLDVTADPTRAQAKPYLMGLLALRARDLKAAREALLSLQAAPELPRSSIAADLALSLQARILAAAGDHKGALALLDRQKLLIPERYYAFYGRVREHFFRASLLTALGRPREALPLYDALAVYDLVDRAFFPAAQLYTARIYDSLGENERAAEHYQRFAAMWKDCDPEERPELQRAQARLSGLREHAGAPGP